MDAVEFIKTRARICRVYEDCENCILADFCRYTCDKQSDVAEQAVANALEWAKEHPVKTRQSEMLKMFPETEMIDDYICICPSRFSKEYRDSDASYSIECNKCKRDFWLKEIE